MTYGRAAIPAVIGSLLFALLLWWAGAGVHALHLRGATGVLGIESTNELLRWLAPWSYDPPGSGDTSSGADARYAGLYATAMQIRYVAVFVFFLVGALLLVRRIPPVRGRTPATVLALWAWSPVAGALAVTVSAPWLIASQGNGSYRVLPQLATVIASSGPVTVFAGLLTALLTVPGARITAKGADPLPRRIVPRRAGRLAASAGTAVIALSLVVLSHASVAARIQTSWTGTGLLSEPGDLLRLWLLLGAWSGPGTASLGYWLLHRVPDVVLLVVVWWALRLSPTLLTRTTVPAMAAGGVCATVLGLLSSQVMQMAIDHDTATVWGPVHLFSRLGTGAPAALVFGTAAGITAFVTLRLTRGAGDMGIPPRAG
ncbi:hypothetical protein ACWCPM_33755 [Streptomyces sp. NPDC002309]